MEWLEEQCRLCNYFNIQHWIILSDEIVIGMICVIKSKYLLYDFRSKKIIISVAYNIYYWNIYF